MKRFYYSKELLIEFIVGITISICASIFPPVGFLVGFFPTKNSSDAILCALLFIVSGITTTIAILYGMSKVSCYYSFLNSEVCIKRGQKKENVPFTFYKYVYLGHYTEGTFGIKRRVNFLLISHYRISKLDLERVNRLDDPYLIRIQYSEKNKKYLHQCLPPHLKEQFEHLWNDG